MKINPYPSPNFDSRGAVPVDMLVLHYTGMPTAEAALKRMCDPAAKVSAHYMIDEDGTVYQLVQEESRAWHAGVSAWRGHTDINARSVGIEIVNPGHEFGYRPFPKVQMRAVARLCKEVIARHSISARNVVAHSDIAPERKEDPGELFDWQWLAGQGVGLWPTKEGSGILNLEQGVKVSDSRFEIQDSGETARVLQRLAEYGYNCPASGMTDERTSKIITAFQRHFRPLKTDGLWDDECAKILQELLKLAVRS